MQHTTLFLAYLAIASVIGYAVDQPQKIAQEAPQEKPVVVEQTTVVEQVVEEQKQKTEWTKDEVIELIQKYSEEFGANETIALNIAKCESGYRYNAKNPSQKSSASGVYQTIRSTANAWGIDDPMNADQNIRESVRRIADGQLSHWNASRSCWGR